MVGTVVEKMAVAAVRGCYGEVKNVPPRGKELLALAIKQGKLDASYASFDSTRRGEAMNYDFYDCTATGSAAIIQQRWAKVTKYGTSCTKNYYLLRRQGRGVVAEDYDVHKTRIVKLAKAATAWGEVIKTLKAWDWQAKGWAAYKIVELRSDGTLWSVFDGKFKWTLGKCRIESATGNHSGGYYCYKSAEEAERQLLENKVFNSAWMDGKNLALVECVAAGQVFQHANEKLCVSVLMPKRVLKVLSGPQEKLAA